MPRVRPPPPGAGPGRARISSDLLRLRAGGRRPGSPNGDLGDRGINCDLKHRLLTDDIACKEPRPLLLEAYMDVRPLQAFALSAGLIATLFPSTVFADSGARMDRLNGTVGFDQADGAKTDVLNGADLSPGAEAFAACFSQARVTLANGSTLTIGAGTSLLTPAQSG